MTDSHEEFGETADAALAAAEASLAQGQLQQARQLAQSVLNRAQGHDLDLEARALSCLAHCDRVGSRLRRSSEASRRAAQLFEQLGDAAGEANALITLTHVLMLLGRNEEAVEAALLCARLCDKLPLQPMTVLAFNCLGLAYSWAGDHDRGDAALELAVKSARRCSPSLSIFQPRLNQVWVEASRLLDERFQTGSMQSLARLESLLEECVQLESAGRAQPVLPGLQAMARSISLASSALVTIWRGDLAAAERKLEEAADSLSTKTTWLDSFVHWCHAELAWAKGDWVRAQDELVEMKKLALVVEHEQLACRAHLLLIQVYELQHKHEEAQREHRALRRRERRVVSEGMAGREALVSWRLGARHSEQHLREALVESKRFERWSLEDALTGIANRRHFEQALAEALRAAESADRSLTVAMVDVDRFKTVNDRFSHLVGDRVLKTIAGILRSQVRPNDLVARWAGDEFVIMFAFASPREAEQICERVQTAVRDFDWESVAPGLRMSVSIGLSDARNGDMAEAVVARSDDAMYRVKHAVTLVGD